MIALEQARQYLESLGIKQAVVILDNTMDTAANKQLTYPEMLEHLLAVEVQARSERCLITRTKIDTSPSSAPWSDSTSPSSRPSTRGRSRNWPAWP